jgi:hypothetical protein
MCNANKLRLKRKSAVPADPRLLYRVKHMNGAFFLRVIERGRPNMSTAEEYIGVMGSGFSREARTKARQIYCSVSQIMRKKKASIANFREGFSPPSLTPSILRSHFRFKKMQYFGADVRKAHWLYWRITTHGDRRGFKGCTWLARTVPARVQNKH